MAQHERWYASARLFMALGLVAAVIWIGNAQAASTAGAARATAARQGTFDPPICRHDQTSEWSCPQDDTAKGKKAKKYKWSGDHENIDSVDVTYWKGRFPMTVKLREKHIDAVFFSKYAVKNFLLRYYNATDKVKAKAVSAYVNVH